MRLLRRGVAGLGCGLAMLISIAAPPGHAADDTGFSVTFAARECDHYSDIMANGERNNIQESLKDLGKDSVYQPGQSIGPDVETPNDPACRPLTGWSFTLGSYIAGPKIDGLSLVGGGPQTVVTTQPATPLLDGAGRPTGGTLQGATTFHLPSDDLTLAERRNLWVQGGLVGDPLMQAAFGTTYSFGALRCAIDNRNADNVEWVGYPGNSRHVFCYYYAVRKTPEPGTIVVRKELAGEPDSQVFHFHGNVSYNPDGHFAIGVHHGAPGSMSFRRASTGPGDVPWTFQEDPAPGWQLASLACDSQSGTSTTVISGTSVAVTLGADDTVTCTYRDTRELAGRLTLFKQTVGGVGGPFTMSAGLVGGPRTPVGSATTTEEATPVEVGGLPQGPPGTYDVTETLPAPNRSGHWTLRDVRCDGIPRSAVQPDPTTASFTVDATTREQNCLVTNEFHPRGSITVLKTTHGGTGTTLFQISPLDPSVVIEEDHVPTLTATTHTPNRPTQATGGPLTGLPLGTYLVSELRPVPTSTGFWRVTAAHCSSARTPSPGEVLVTLDARHPHSTCTFENTFIHTPRPPRPVKPHHHHHHHHHHRPHHHRYHHRRCVRRSTSPCRHW